MAKATLPRLFRRAAILVKLPQVSVSRSTDYKERDPSTRLATEHLHGRIVLWEKQLPQNQGSWG